MSETISRTVASEGSGTPAMHWRAGRLVAVALLCAAAGLIYWPSALALGKLWTQTQNRTYLHGFLILIISLWLIARDRERLESAPLRPVPWALAGVLLLSALWLIALRAAVRDLHLVLLPLIILAALLASFGWAVLRILLFPIGYLYVAMPLWTDLVGILRPLSVAAVDALIWLTGLPAFMDGNVVHLPAGTLVIEDGCSGLHFLIVGLAMAALYGELSRDRLRQRLVWLLSMGAIAVLANWIRIFIIVLAAYATNMQTPLVADHYWVGWVVFAVGFVAFLWSADRWAGMPGSKGASSPAERSAPRGPAVNVRSELAALGCMAVLPVLAYATDPGRGADEAALAIVWPTGQGAWQGPQAPVSSWHPLFANPSAAAERRYLDPSGGEVEVFAVAYRTQRSGAKLVSWDNSLLGREGALRSAGERIVSTSGGPWLESTLIDGSGQQSLIWRRYQIGDRFFVKPHVSELWYGISTFVRQPLSSLVALRAICEPDCGSARARLESATALVPAIRTGTLTLEAK